MNYELIPSLKKSLFDNVEDIGADFNGKLTKLSWVQITKG